VDVTSDIHGFILQRSEQTEDSGLIGCGGLQRSERTHVAVSPRIEGNCLNRQKIPSEPNPLAKNAYKVPLTREIVQRSVLALAARA
jgi:hypothetical protein